MTGFNPARHWKKCTCPSCERRRKNRQEIWASVLVVLVILVCGLVFGCSATRTPQRVDSQQASFDQGERNSGVLQQTLTGGVITAHARDRYNALIDIYGREFLPPLQRDFGITPRPDGTNDITNEAWENFILMNAWRRMGRVPGMTKSNQ